METKIYAVIDTNVIVSALFSISGQSNPATIIRKVEECDGVVIASISGNATIVDEDIPDDIDILVTHDPPYGILDEDMGSLNLLNFILKAKPRYHLFGHIHSTAGQSQKFGSTECVNIAATVFL